MKKIVLVGLMLLSNFAFAQDNCDVKVINDELTRKTIVTTDPVIINEISMNFIGGNYRGEYHKMFFKVEEKPCIDFRSMVYILFDDGSRIERGNVLKYNCNGFSEIIINSKKDRESLKTKKIKSIQVSAFNSVYRIEVEEEQSDILQKQYQCLEERNYLKLVEYKY
ncbi:hypothetical protein [Myroides odoratimimus]|uniref:hypothetical protein n=1 Tax=Myroides odoratimimus TaxID=76832 RepID=UPI00257506D7|nr:hypothetical protein [Myroides odoratimimus]MDM1530144.1 hypothetical protein [Myroides odoratimimus]